MILYDILDDAKNKLVGTIVYYKGKAVFVKDVQPMDTDDGVKYVVYMANLNGGKRMTALLDDPDLNYMNFNLGYANAHGYACWWFRHPMRQYAQGLKAGQLGRVASRREFYDMGFNYNGSICKMLENSYPKFQEIEKELKDEDQLAIAFHRDFAASWDKVHRDMIIEYKGRLIGHSTNLKDFELMDEYKYLTEALKEAVA